MPAVSWQCCFFPEYQDKKIVVSCDLPSDGKIISLVVADEHK